MAQNRPLQFPDGFLWGTACSAETDEGAIHAGGRGPSIWDTFSHTPGKTLNGDTGDIAVDQYHRYPQDVAMMAELGYSAYRFSIAWPRIQATGVGPANADGIDHYRRLIEALLSKNITPMVTLYHWDLPQALENYNGWLNRDTAYRFADYVELVYKALGDVVPFFLCLNEPASQAIFGYYSGAIAPGVGGYSLTNLVKANHYQLLGQGLAVKAMRALQRPIGQRPQIGTTLDLFPVVPATQHPTDVAAAALCDGQYNRMYLDPIYRGAYPEDMLHYYGQHDVPLQEIILPGDNAIIAQPLDFFGLNYYTTWTVAASATAPNGFVQVPPAPVPVQITPTGVSPPDGGVTAMGWIVSPQNFTAALQRVKTYTDQPIYITENGAAYRDYRDAEGCIKDSERIAFLNEHIAAMHDAMQQGIDVRGYFVWCFQDNFASTNGYSMKFGLVWTDFPSLARVPKESAKWYGRVAKANALP